MRRKPVPKLRTTFRGRRLARLTAKILTRMTGELCEMKGTRKCSHIVRGQARG